MPDRKCVKVCMLTARHSALDDRIFYKECISLNQAGYEIIIVAPCSDDGCFTDMSGRKIRIDETNNSMPNKYGIEIRGYVKKPKGWRRYISTVTGLIKAGLAANADIYHCHEVDASLFAGIRIKKEFMKQDRNVKLIYDSHEYWPGAFEDRFSNRLLKYIVKRFITWWEKRALKYCDYIITANSIVRGYFLLLDRFANVEVLYNCPRLELFKENTIGDKPFGIICHEGSLPFDRGLKIMVEAIRKLKQKNSSVKLLIVGDVFGDERKWLNQKVKEYSLENNIELTGWLPYEDVGEHIQKASIGLILFQPTKVNNMLGGPPNKLFNYMRYGLPVVSADFPEMRRIINENDCGLLINPTDVDSLYDALHYLLTNPDRAEEMGKNGKKAVESLYNWKEMGKRLVRVYETLNS